jgi:putative oxidoreductase
MDLGRTILRGTIGPLMIGHGTQKLFGWFGGHGLEGTGSFFEGIGLRPGRRHAAAGGAAETLGGALLTLGALTPLASTLVSSVMMTAIRKVHLKNGPWVTSGGYEYNLALIAATAALVEAGPGRPSVDEALFPRLKGNGWMLASIAAAAAGSWLATERFNEAAPEAAPAEEPALEREPRFTREPTEAPADVT